MKSSRQRAAAVVTFLLLVVAVSVPVEVVRHTIGRQAAATRLPAAASPRASSTVVRPSTAAPGSTRPIRAIHPRRTGPPHGGASADALTRAQYLVLFVLDGARPDYLTVSGIPHLEALIHQGTQYRNAFAGILESETPSGHAALGSGSNPSANGILSFYWANSDNTTVNLFSPQAVNGGQMDRILKLAPAPSIAQLVKAKDPGARVVALSGHKYYAADALGGPAADAIMYYTGTPKGTFAPVAVPGHIPPRAVLATPGLIAPSTTLKLGVEDHLAMRLADTTFTHMHPKVLMANIPEFDWPLGHVWGADRDRKDVVSLMRGFDRDLGHLEDDYRRAGILDKTLFVVTADHGFAPIYHTVSHDAIAAAITRAGTSVLEDSYHTAAYVWLKNAQLAAAAAENVAQLQDPLVQSVYFKSPAGVGKWDYLRASGPDLFYDPATEAANQYLLGTFAGPSSPQLAIFFTEDAASLPAGEAGWKGDHGGAGWESQHIPLVFSGPGVRAGVTSSFPARLIDVAPTALALMGIPSTGMQGLHLADAMESPRATDGVAQASMSRTLLPVVTALQRESAAEVAAGK